MNKRFYALGRLKRGEKNKTEIAYDLHLDILRVSGEILWYKFEGIKLKLANNTFLTVDFAAMRKDGVLTMIDVKGSPHVFMDDAKAKMKIAAEMYPFVFVVVYPRPKKLGGGWIENEI